METTYVMVEIYSEAWLQVKQCHFKPHLHQSKCQKISPKFWNPPPFMESECSLPCSRDPASGPYPEPGASNSQIPNLFP
jgi:hypothetical protein